MNDLLSQAIKEAYAIGGASVQSYDTLEIRHPSQPTSIFIVKALHSITANLEDGAKVTFEAVGFNIRLPSSTSSGAQFLDIAIDNVDNRVGAFIEQTKASRDSVVIVYRPYLASDLSTPQMIPPLQLYLRAVKVRPEVITARASFVEVVNKRFPSEDYNRQRFPSLGG